MPQGFTESVGASQSQDIELFCGPPSCVRSSQQPLEWKALSIRQNTHTPFLALLSLHRQCLHGGFQ